MVESREIQGKRKLTRELKAILATDLGKIFSFVLVFITTFLIIPLIYPLLSGLETVIINSISGPIPATDQLFFLVVAIMGIILLIAFFGFGVSLLLIKLAFWINKKLAPKLRRSNLQHRLRYVVIIVGFILGLYLVEMVYTLFNVGAGGDIFNLVTLFTNAILMCFIFVTLLLTSIYICIFINDIAFYIYRSVADKPLVYTPPEERVITRRHKNALRILSIVFIIIIIAMGFIIYFVKPAVIHINQRSGAIISSGADRNDIIVKSYEIYAGTMTPTEFRSLIENPPISSDGVVGVVIYKIPGPLWPVHNLEIYSFDFSFSIPRGLNIVAFKLTLDIDTGFTFNGSAYFYPTSNYQCTFLTKSIQLTQISVESNTTAIVGFTFNVAIKDFFQFSDLLNFGW